MKITLKELLKIKHSVKKLLGQSVKISVMFQLRHFVHDVTKAVEEFEEHRNKVIKRLGVRSGARWILPEDKPEVYNEYDTEMEELLKQEVEIRTCKVKTSDFAIAKENIEIIDTDSGSSMVKVPPLNVLDVANLSFLFEDEQEKGNE